MKPLHFVFLVVLIMGCASHQEKYLKYHPEITGDQAQAILGETITFGLDKEAVRVSLGVPKKVFGYMNEGKQMEVWVYSEFEWHPYENALFENGKVVSWNFPKSVTRELKERAAKELLSGKRPAEESSVES